MKEGMVGESCFTQLESENLMKICWTLPMCFWTESEEMGNAQLAGKWIK